MEDCKTLPFVAVCHGETPAGFLALRQTAPQAGEVDVIGTLPAGFLALRQTAPQAGEVDVMGTLPAYHRKGAGRALLAWAERYARAYHRKGAGRALLAWAERYARAAGWKLLQVKTVDTSHPSPEYARTRAFYHAMGFVDLECFPTLWDAGNPCLVLVKAL